MADSLSDSYARLPLEQIYVDRKERQRRELDTTGLKDSIAARGVLNPIIVERAAGPGGLHKLVAGERRYKACQELGLPDVPVRFADTLSPIESQIIELEENIKRKDLSWQDEVLATERIHGLYKQLFPDWTQEKTAESIGTVKSNVSMYLKVAAVIATGDALSERVAAAPGHRDAYNIIKKREDREHAALIDRLHHNIPLEIGPEEDDESAPVPMRDQHDFNTSDDNPAKNILLEDFVQWAPRYNGAAFNFIHCDFPYGINVFGGPQSGREHHETYKDEREIHFKLLETLLVNFDRIASQSVHVMYWFSIQHLDRIRSMVMEIQPDLIIWTHPLIWMKSDQSGIASDPQHAPRHVYETALLMTRGRRKIAQLMTDGYHSPPIRDEHVHAKPEPMLKHFFTMFVDHTTAMLDPTCGSASSIRAAEALGAHSALGMDVDEGTVAQARTALRRHRAMRTADLVIDE